MLLSEALKVEVGGDATDYNKVMKGLITTAGKTVKDVGAKFDKLGKDMMKYGGMMTAAIGGFGGLAVKEAADAEKSFAKLAGLFKESVAVLEPYKNAIKELAWTMGIDTVETTEAFYQAVSSGFRSVEDAAHVTTAAAEAAVAGATQLPVAVEAITRVLNAYKWEGEKAQYVSDLLFQTVNYGVTEFGLLAPVIGRVAGSAAQARVPVEDLFGAFATITKMLKTEESVVAANQLILAFLKPTDQAKEAAEGFNVSLNATALASKGLYKTIEDIIKALGITSEELDALAKAAEGGDMMEALAAKYGKASEGLAELFPNVRALRAAMALTAEGGKEFAANVELMKDPIGATSNALNKATNTLSYQFNLLWKRTKQLREQIGDLFLEDLKDLTKQINKMMPDIKAWIKEHESLIKGFFKWGLAIGAGTIALGVFSMTFGKLLKLIPTVIAGFSKIVFFFMNPWTLAITAAIGAALYLFAIFAPTKVKEIWTGFKSFLADGVAKMKDYIHELQNMGDSQEEVMGAIAKSPGVISEHDMLKTQIEDLEERIKLLKDAQKGLEKETQEAQWITPYSELEAGFAEQWKIYEDQITGLSTKLTNLQSQFANMPAEIAKNTDEAGKLAGEIGKAADKAGEGGLLGSFGDLEKTLGDIEKALRGKDPITAWLEDLESMSKQERIRYAAETIVDAFKAAMDVSWELFYKMPLELAGEFFTEFFQLGKDIVDYIWEGIETGWDHFKKWIVSAAELLASEIKAAFEGALPDWLEYAIPIYGIGKKLTGTGEGGQMGKWITGPPGPDMAMTPTSDGEAVIAPNIASAFYPLVDALVNAGSRGSSYHDAATYNLNFQGRWSKRLFYDEVLPTIQGAKRRGLWSQRRRY